MLDKITLDLEDKQIVLSEDSYMITMICDLSDAKDIP